MRFENSAAEAMREASAGTFSQFLGVEFLEMSPERVVGTMEVRPELLQPGGILHGGASISLAETLASMGTVFNIDVSRETCMGQEITASHLASTSSGTVTGIAVPVSRSRSAMQWDVRISREDGRLISWVRCTIAIRPHR